MKGERESKLATQCNLPTALVNIYSFTFLYIIKTIEESRAVKVFCVVRTDGVVTPIYDACRYVSSL